MELKKAFNFNQWIEDHRHLLKPPVGNQVVFKGNDDFIVMVCGGPNQRKDYHYNEGEELFFQIEGSIVVKVVDDGKAYEIPVNAGEMMLLPPKVYHSPQRMEGSVGLVIEKIRSADDQDGIVYFCDACGHKIFEELFHLENIVEQLPAVFDKFYSSESNRTCEKCGDVMQTPENWKPKSACAS